VKRATLAAGTSLAFLLAGCASRPPPGMPSEPVPLSASDPLLTTLVEGWADLVEARSSLRGGMVLKLSGPNGEQRLSQNLVLARPARIRMEIQSFLMTAAVLVADENRYDYFQSGDRYREGGPVYPHLLWEIAGVPLTLEQAVAFLLGAPPARPGLAPSGGERASDGTVRVDLHDARGGLARKLWFGAEGQLARAEEWSPSGQLLWQVAYDRYREVGERTFAHSIEFEFPPLASAATAAFRSVELNPHLPPGIFELQLADGEGGSP